MDAFHHHQQSLRPIGPPIGGDPPPPPPPQHHHQQNPFWYPSSSPPPPPGGYHHHQIPHLSPMPSASAPLPPHQQNYLHHHPPYPPPPPQQQQWEHAGDPHHHHIHLQQQHPPVPPLPPVQPYHNHMPYSASVPPPHRYPPPPHPHHMAPLPLHPHPSDYPHPTQAWGNSYCAQNQGWEHPERNFPYNNEQDWAARAREWAAAKPVTGSHHSPSQFGPIGRMDEHNYAYHDQSQEAVGPPSDMQQPSFFQLRNQQLPDLKQENLRRTTSFTSGSSYGTDGLVRYNAEDGPLSSNTDYMASPKKSYGPSPSLYEQEVPYIYSSAPGNRETVIHSESSPLPLPVSSVQEGLLHSQSTLAPRNIPMELPHFTHGGQSTKTLTDASDLPLNFEPRSASEHETRQKISYGHVDPAVSTGVMDHAAMATSIHAWNPSVASGVAFSQIPFAPSGTQFDTSFVSQPPLPVHTAPIFGISGPNFRPSIPPVSAPFGLGNGTSVHHASAFPGDNGVFNLSERPKKAAVPNWLREEIIKKKSAITNAVPTFPNGNSFSSTGSEDADNSFRTANQVDSKSIESTKSNEDEEDDEDDVEAAKSAAINQEIKRVLTEILLKVTDQLFDEIATKVLNENDLSVEVDETAVSGNYKVSPSPPAVPTPKASAKVLVQVNKNNDSASENSSPNSPGGDILGLANYASDDDDDDDETGNSTMLSSGMIAGASKKQDRNVLKEMEKGNVLVDLEPSLGPRDTENGRNRMDVHGAPGNHIARNKEENFMTENASRSADDLYYHEKASDEASGISVAGENVNEASLQNAKALKPKDTRQESTTGTANNGNSITGVSITVNSKSILGYSGNPEKRNHSRDIVKQVKDGMDKTGRENSELSDSIVHDRNVLKRKMDKRDTSKERFEGVKRGADVRDSSSRSTSKYDSIKDDRKETPKDKREKNKEVGERKRELTRDEKEDQSLRVTKNTFEYNRTSSSSPSSRGRKSKENSSYGHGSASSDEPSRNSEKSKPHSNRTSLSPSPTRSRKSYRQVSRSPHSKHSHRRHSPYSSLERRRISRSRSPGHRRSAHKR